MIKILFNTGYLEIADAVREALPHTCITAFHALHMRGQWGSVTKKVSASNDRNLNPDSLSRGFKSRYVYAPGKSLIVETTFDESRKVTQGYTKISLSE